MASGYYDNMPINDMILLFHSQLIKTIVKPSWLKGWGYRFLSKYMLTIVAVFLLITLFIYH